MLVFNNSAGKTTPFDMLYTTCTSDAVVSIFQEYFKIRLPSSFDDIKNVQCVHLTGEHIALTGSRILCNLVDYCLLRGQALSRLSRRIMKNDFVIRGHCENTVRM